MGWMVRGSNPSEDDTLRTRGDRPWCPPSFIYNGNRVFSPGVERPGRNADHSPPSSAEVKDGIKLYLYPPLGTHGPF
jgi:hypothetical protein